MEIILVLPYLKNLTFGYIQLYKARKISINFIWNRLFKVQIVCQLMSLVLHLKNTYNPSKSHTCILVIRAQKLSNVDMSHDLVSY